MHNATDFRREVYKTDIDYISLINRILIYKEVINKLELFFTEKETIVSTMALYTPHSTNCTMYIVHISSVQCTLYT